MRLDLQRIALRTAGIAAADLVSQSTRVLVMLAPIHWADAARLIGEIGRNGLLLSLGLAVALEFHELPSLRNRPVTRWCCLGATAAVAVILSCRYAVTGISAVLGVTASEQALRMHASWNNTIVALVAIAYLTRRRESQETEDRRLDAARRLEQARQRLHALAVRTGDSRIEPQMVIDRLHRARDLYSTDLARGDAELDALACQLRSALKMALDASATPTGSAEAVAERRVPGHRHLHG